MQNQRTNWWSGPVLSSPRDEGDYFLVTDASRTGLGAMLQQLQGGDLKVIAYASRYFINFFTTFRNKRSTTFVHVDNAIQQKITR
jgi:hypothetical protein